MNEFEVETSGRWSRGKGVKEFDVQESLSEDSLSPFYFTATPTSLMGLSEKIEL